MSLPQDYFERVYAGVLGKIVGVYLGRPFEGWSYEKITSVLGDINYYVHEKLDVPLVVTDDDISGTFTFLRALEDYGYDKNLTPRQIGKTWMNYLIEEQTILWWGGMGKFNRTYCLFAFERRYRCTYERVYGIKWKSRGRTNWCSNFY